MGYGGYEPKVVGYSTASSFREPQVNLIDGISRCVHPSRTPQMHLLR